MNKTSNDYAREFKLPSCIGNKKFEKQVKQILLDGMKEGMKLAAYEMVGYVGVQTGREYALTILNRGDKLTLSDIK